MKIKFINSPAGYVVTEGTFPAGDVASGGGFTIPAGDDWVTITTSSTTTGTIYYDHYDPTNIVSVYSKVVDPISKEPKLSFQSNGHPFTKIFK